MNTEDMMWIGLSLFHATHALLGLPLIRGSVGRNRGYGLRLRSTLADDRVWYPANRTMGWALVLGAGVTCVLAAVRVSGLVPVPIGAAPLVMVIGALSGCAAGGYQARRLCARLGIRVADPSKDERAP